MPTTLEQIQYGFDRNSRRTWQKRPLTDMQDQQYNYDSLSQVSAAARGNLNLNATAISGVPASAENWGYDPTGNWRGYHTAANGVSTLDQHRVHDRGNRLTQIEDNPHNMILDRVGRMRQMSPDAAGDWEGKLELTWDAWSRITRVKNNGTVVGNYTYDGTHRRVTRAVGEDTLHSYYNDVWRPVEERKDAETTAAMSYLWGARHRDDLVRRDRAVGGATLNETRYILMDYFNPAAITDGSGVVKERYAFSAFGVRTILNPDFTARSGSESGMEFAFQGQFLDVESGLMNYGYRCYAPYLGRWTFKDPIAERGGLNLYEMCQNSTVNQVDLLGLDNPVMMWQHFQGIYPPIPQPPLPPPLPPLGPVHPYPVPPAGGTKHDLDGSGRIIICCSKGQVVAVNAKLTGPGGLLSDTFYIKPPVTIPYDTRGEICCSDKAIRISVSKSIKYQFTWNINEYVGLKVGSVVASYAVFDNNGVLIGTDATLSPYPDSVVQKGMQDALLDKVETIKKVKSILSKFNWVCPK